MPLDDLRGDRLVPLAGLDEEDRGDQHQSGDDRQPRHPLPTGLPEGTCRGRRRLPLHRFPPPADHPLVGLDGVSQVPRLVDVWVHGPTLPGLPDVGNG
ncbi:MAG: hypothetical protein IH939_08530 [Acidobacteria bacterium]|nr:hypothetical protein [Acidobacteriota bacterium]